MLALLVLTFSILNCVYSDPRVKIGNTNIIGKDILGISSPVEFFGGIPYARPPVGDLRLALPAPLPFPALGVKTLTAKEFGPGCLQNPAPPSGVSEDCLTLDIYRPRGISVKSKIPVLVWIYGGGFVVGDSSYYNASDLVARSVIRGTPIIVVTINYRLGPLGFPQGIEAGRRKILNLGLHDQIAALEWLQKYIANFGGDKAKVTISGESAGAYSVMTHMLQSRIKGLARGAIVESTGGLPMFSPETHEADWQQYVKAIPACASSVGTNNTFTCIKQVDSAALQQALVITGVNFATFVYTPVLDGPNGFYVDRFSKITSKGNLPTLIGHTSDEGTIITNQAISTDAEVRNSLVIRPSIVSEEKIEAVLSEALKLYPDIPALGAPFGTGNETFGLNSQYKRASAIAGDYLLISNTRTVRQQMSRAGVPVYTYIFSDNDAVAVPEFAPPSAAPGSLGVTHTTEIPYVFGQLINKTPSASALSVMVQDYWISFVNSLNPNDKHGSKRPHWDQYTPKNQVVMDLNGKKSRLIPDTYRAKQIELWQNNPDVFLR